MILFGFFQGTTTTTAAGMEDQVTRVTTMEAMLGTIPVMEDTTRSPMTPHPEEGVPVDEVDIPIDAYCLQLSITFG